ncbi:MAG: type II toxin-antitoxin system PemK/MazF family toxin [Rhodococcus sp.]|nr:type II toxin-antitoxin system PemK/MazF family toxin [Rhodococcus sp. (in: high G+C Gram-positive bacteria)]
MASRWKSLGSKLSKLAREHGPGLLEQVQKSEFFKRGSEPAGTAVPGASKAEKTAPKPGPKPGPRPGRPVASRITPTEQCARTIEYSPDLDGRADPGEIVWTWVAYEEDPTQGKDRPVLVVGRNGQALLGLMLSSQDKGDRERDWVAIGSGSWDPQGRPSWVRLDRIIDVPEDGIRREGAVVDRQAFNKVAARLRSDFGWN